MKNVVWLIAVSILCACGSDSGSDKADVPAEIAIDAAAEVIQDVALAEVIEETVAEVAEDVLVPPFPFGFESRGWTLLRGIVHLHSALSHDGCGPDGYEDYGGPDPDCISELRAAPCISGIDFMFMTDHPGEAKYHTFEEGLQYRAAEGDEIIYDEQDRPYANRITCPEGSLVESSLFYVGTEGTKHMPIGMAGPVPMEVYETPYSDDIPLEQAQAAVAIVHSLGGWVYAPHTEEPNIPVERIVELPLDGMEIYNVHTNLMQGLDDLENIFAIDKFMAEGPDPDLALLPFFAAVDKDVTKFDQAAAQIRIAHIAATDIHRNVEIPALCPGGIEGSMCEAFVDDYPNFANFMQTGGPFPLSDGDRMDSYERSFRWFSNYAVTASGDPADIREAIGMGRSYSAFDMFGQASGFDFFVVGDGEAIEMGTELAGVGEALAYIRTPTLENPPWRTAELFHFKGKVTTKLVRATLAGSEVLLEEEGQGLLLEVPLPGPGAYRVEISIVPYHLKEILIGVEQFASKEYPYIYSNAIFLR